MRPEAADVEQVPVPRREERGSLDGVGLRGEVVVHEARDHGHLAAEPGGLRRQPGDRLGVGDDEIATAQQRRVRRVEPEGDRGALDRPVLRRGAPHAPRHLGTGAALVHRDVAAGLLRAGERVVVLHPHDRRVARGLEREVAVDHPVVRVHRVGPFALDDAPQRRGDHGVGERGVVGRALDGRERATEPLVEPLDPMDAEPDVLDRVGRVTVRLDHRDHAHLVATADPLSNEREDVGLRAADGRGEEVGQVQDPHRAAALVTPPRAARARVPDRSSARMRRSTPHPTV